MHKNIIFWRRFIDDCVTEVNIFHHFFEKYFVFMGTADGFLGPSILW